MAKYNGNLARGMEDILDNIRGAFDFRLQSLGQTIAETHGKLHQFKKDRQEMGEDLRNFLFKFKDQLQKGEFDRVKDFKQFFTKLSHENKDAAKELKGFLKKYNLDRLSDFVKFIKPLQNELKGMHEAFLGFTQNMQNKRRKPFGAQIKPFSTMRAVQRQRESGPQEIRSGESFKVKAQGRKPKKKARK